MSADDRYHHGNLRAALLSAAEEELRQHGAEGLSLREVARRTGVSHAAPYAHFANKQELLAALMEKAAEGLDNAMEEAQRMAAQDPVSQWLATGLGYVNYGVSHTQMFFLMSRPDLCPPTPQGMPSPDGQGPFSRLLRSLEVVPGAPNRHDPGFMRDALLCWMVVHGLVALAASGQLAQTGMHPIELTRQLLERLRDLYTPAH